MNKKDYSISNEGILKGIIESNGYLILENISKSILYPKAIIDEGWDVKMAECFYNITNYVYKLNLKLLDFDYMIILLFRDIKSLKGNLKTYLNFEGYIKKYGKSNLILSNENIISINNFVIKDLTKIMKKYYYFNMNKEQFKKEYLNWLNLVINSLNINNEGETSKDYNQIEPIKINCLNLSNKVRNTSFLFLSHLSKCILYLNHFLIEDWLDNATNLFHEITLFVDDETNSLIPFEEMIDELIICGDLFDEYVEAWSNLGIYIKKYRKPLLINDKHNFLSALKMVDEELPKVLKEHYYFNTNKERVKESLIDWVRKTAVKLGYNIYSKSYLYGLENMPNQKLNKEDYPTDKLDILDEPIRGQGLLIIDRLTFSILFPKSIKDYKWDYKIAKRFYELTTRVLKPRLELLDFDYMIILLYGSLNILSSNLEIDDVHDEYINKYGNSNYINSKKNLMIITNSIIKDLTKVFKKHYYFNMDQEKFRIDYLKWFNKLIKKLGYNKKKESY